jgi:acyl-CoA thioesterase FadM
MARVKIQLTEHFLSSIQIPVRISDINYGQHVGNDSIVGYLHEARVQWLSSMQYNELDIEGAALIQSELVVNYLKEIFYGDLITVDIFLGEESGSGFELYYKLTTKRNELNLVLALAKTGMVFYDYEQKKVIAAPPRFFEKIKPGSQS